MTCEKALATARALVSSRQSVWQVVEASARHHRRPQDAIGPQYGVPQDPCWVIRLAPPAPRVGASRVNIRKLRNLFPLVDARPVSDQPNHLCHM